MRYPDLSHCTRICIDIETYDPNLIEKGPGVYRKDGYIIGVAVAWDDGKEWYPFTGLYGPNLIALQEFNNNAAYSPEIAGNIEYIKGLLALSCDKVGANILYDMDWLVNGMGMKVNGTLVDIQVIEPLLDEYSRHYSLEALSQKYLGISKKTDILERFCEVNNIKWKKDVRTILYMLPPTIVGEYAIGDVDNTLRVLDAQMIEIKRLGLENLLAVEQGNTSVLLRMRKQGVDIDMIHAQKAEQRLKRKVGQLKWDFYNDFGDYNVNSALSLRKLFDKLNIPVGRNIKGEEGFDAKTLEHWVKHPVAQRVLEVRKAEKAHTYLVNSILDFVTESDGKRGKIHASFRQLSGDDGGTVSGRYASSKPNLQQVSHVIRKPDDPLYEDDYGVILRSCFIPLEGKQWVKMDYKQIEYMFIAHYGIGPTAITTRQKLIDDLTLDFHTNTMQLTGIKDRREVKEINFGEAYFIGVAKLAFRNGWSREYTQDLMTKLRERMPFIRETANEMLTIARSRDATRQGYLRTIGGRYARVNDFMRRTKTFEGQWGKKTSDSMYPLFNRIIQGSAADMFKTALVNIDKAGIFDVVGVPHLLVHDENDMSIDFHNREEKEAMLEMKHLMETAIKLRVPVQVEYDVGPNWGHVKEFEEILEGDE